MLKETQPVVFMVFALVLTLVMLGSVVVLGLHL